MIAPAKVPVDILAMNRWHRNISKSASPRQGDDSKSCTLAALATAGQIAEVLQISARTVHNLAARGEIPVALRAGKIVRFCPMAVATALGLDASVFDPPRTKAPTPAKTK